MVALVATITPRTTAPLGTLWGQGVVTLVALKTITQSFSPKDNFCLKLPRLGDSVVTLEKITQSSSPKGQLLPWGHCVFGVWWHGGDTQPCPPPGLQQGQFEALQAQGCSHRELCPHPWLSPAPSPGCPLAVPRLSPGCPQPLTWQMR